MPTLAAWLHDIDPFMIQFTSDWGIRWYGMAYLLGFVLGYLAIRRVVRVGRTTLLPQHVLDFIVVLALGVVLGGRLGYVLFYRPELAWTFYARAPFWGLIAINQGGMASHGGIVGTVLAAWYYAWKHKHDLPHLLDLLAFGTPLGLFFGRIANFINGELFGRICSPGFPLAVKFPQEITDWPTLHPGKLAELAPAAHALGVEPARWAARLAAFDHSARARALVYGVLERLVGASHAAGPAASRVREALRPVLPPRHPSQLYEAVGEGLVVFAVLLWVWRKPRTPGVVGSWFCISYAIVRIVDELWRRPDYFLLHHGAFAAIGITRGQWLSMILLMVGVWGLWYARRRARRRGIAAMGGWRRAEGGGRQGEGGGRRGEGGERRGEGG